MWELWVVLCGCLAYLVWLSWLHYRVIRMGRRKEPGSEILAQALRPLYRPLPVVLLAATGSAVGLVVASTSAAARIVTYPVAAILLLADGWLVAGIVAGHRRQRAERKRELGAQAPTLSTKEMAGLISSGEIKSFARTADGVSLVYADYRSDKQMTDAAKADPAGYDAYVAAARERFARSGQTVMYSDELSPPRHRWIDLPEARDLLDRGEVKTFNYGGPPNEEPASGIRTGIKLIDHGWVRHLYVEPELTATMIPLARAAQLAHEGRPQFCVYGRYETPGE